MKKTSLLVVGAVLLAGAFASIFTLMRGLDTAFEFEDDIFDENSDLL